MVSFVKYTESINFSAMSTKSEPHYDDETSSLFSGSSNEGGIQRLGPEEISYKTHSQIKEIRNYLVGDVLGEGLICL